EPTSRPTSPVARTRRVRPPIVLGTHTMALRPSSVAQRVVLPSPPASSLRDVPDPESEHTRAVSHTVTRCLAPLVTDPTFWQFELECLEAAVPHLTAMLLAPEGDPDALDIPTLHSYAEAITGQYSSKWQTAMDTKMDSWKSRGTYVDAILPPGANTVDGMWIFRVKRPPGSSPVVKARCVA
ncbi:unnamed protein product, partial [Closterium sp. NIES-54]